MRKIPNVPQNTQKTPSSWGVKGGGAGFLMLPEGETNKRVSAIRQAGHDRFVFILSLIPYIFLFSLFFLVSHFPFSLSPLFPFSPFSLFFPFFIFFHVLSRLYLSLLVSLSCYGMMAIGCPWLAASGTHRPLCALLYEFHTKLTAVESHPDTLTCLGAESGLWISYGLSFSCANQNKTKKKNHQQNGWIEINLPNDYSWVKRQWENSAEDILVFWGFLLIFLSQELQCWGMKNTRMQNPSV